MIRVIRKGSILVGRTGRKVFRQPREALLLMRMACWVTILSTSVRLTYLGTIDLPAARLTTRLHAAQVRVTVE
jgi:hypothetical protein